MLLQTLVWHQSVECLSQSLQIPLHDGRLATVAVSLMFVSRVADIVLGEVVHEAEWSIIDGHVDHAHVVSVEHSMHETNSLPVRNKLGSSHNNDLEELFVDVTSLFCIDLRVEVLNQVIRNGLQYFPVLELAASVELGSLVADLETAKSQE